MAVPTAPIAAGSLIGGYLIARETKRAAGGIVLGAGGAYLTTRWRAQVGPGRAAALLAIYLGGFGGSHPLAKKLGAWPSVLTVAAVSAGASHLIADRAT